MKKKQLDPRAVKLLNKVRAAIKHFPTAYDQSDCGTPEDGEPNCGSPACIVGWAIHFRTLYWSRKKKNLFSYDRLMGELFMTPQQVNRLFSRGRWPSKFTATWRDAGKRGRAKLADARIRHFIKTDGQA